MRAELPAALGVARALATGTWNHDLVVACWDEEERGLLGSAAYVERGGVNTVWTAGGCSSWYLDDTGRNPTLWPWSAKRFHEVMKRPGCADFDLIDAT